MISDRLPKLASCSRPSFPFCQAVVCLEKLWCKRIQKPHSKGRVKFLVVKDITLKCPFHIGQSVDLGIFFETLVRKSPLFEIITPRVLGLIVFLLVPPPQHASGFNSDKLNKLNLELHRRMNEGSDALFITRTELGGKVCLRMAIGGVWTEKKHVQAAFDTFSARATDLLVEQNLLPTKLEMSINGAS